MRKLFTLRILIIFCLTSVLPNFAISQIAAWDFNGKLGNETTVTATTLDANLNTTAVSRGTGLIAASLANAYSSTDFTLNGTFVNAVTNGDFIQFTLNAKTNYKISLSTLDAVFRRSSTGPNKFQWQYSLDGFTSAGINIGSEINYTLTSTNGDAQSQISLSSIASLQNVNSSTTITIRLYGYGATATSGTFALGRLTGNDLAIGGTVTSTISSDATLSNLSLSSGTLNPAFASATTTYTASVANSVSSITVTPTANESNATITVNGTPVTSGSASASISLNVGDNTVTTIVTAQDGTTTKTYTVTVNRASAGTATITQTSALADFGNVCINTTAGPNSFTIDGSNLDGSNSSTISIAALTGYTYSLSSGGTYASTLNFTYTGNSFTGKVIYVKFTPTAVQSYDGNITLSGGGVSSYNVPATGSGVNSAPVVTTNTATNIAPTSATISATINSTGCYTITNYGFFYSTTSGFANGQGTRLVSSNLSGGNFSSDLSGLTPNTRYYFKAYVTNGTDTSYGGQQAFNAAPLPVVMASQANFTFTEDFHDIANWSNFFITGDGANHWLGFGVTGSGGIPNGTTLTAQTQSFQSGSPASPSTSGGVHKGTLQAIPTESIVLLSTGGTDNSSSAAINFYMDFTGVNAGTLSFDWASVNNSTGDRNGSMRVYGSIDGITYTEITAAAVLNFTNNSPTSGSISNIVLPSSFNNNPNARLRFYYYNGTGGITPTGSRPKLSIDNLTVTAVPSTPCTTPTAQPTSMTFGTITDNSIQGSFTGSSPSSDQYMTVVSTNNSLTSTPVDGTTYNVGDAFGDGTVVARGSSTSFTATNLSSSTKYYFFTFALNGVCTGGPKYNTTNPLTDAATTAAGLPQCIAPTTQPSNLTFSNTTINSTQGSFTATTADEYLVLKSTFSSLSANPANGQAYNPGDVIGNADVVSRSATTTFMATGLTPNTQYYFYIFSLNSKNCINGPSYNTVSPLTGSQTTQPLPPCVTPTSQATYLTLTATNTSISGVFNASGSADSYLIIRSTSSTLSATPADNIDYPVGSSLGGGTVIANNSSTSFVTTNLTPATTYYFYVFASNKNCSGGTKYLTTSPLTGNRTTSNALVNNFYFGNLHSHSDYSDGNQDRPGYTPAQDYDYAKTAQCMDFLGISEHNHFSSPNNPGNTIANYHKGSLQADSVNNVSPNFVALYGMEWGVISGGGHVVIYGDGMDNLFGWESGSGVWGPTNNYDVFVAKNDYTGPSGVFKTVNDYVGQNTFATLAHPNLTDYNNLAGTTYNIVADNAIIGTAVESGPSSSTNTTYSNPGSPMYYLWYYQTMLSKGYHLGPVVDHDNHNTTFGKTTYSRTAIVATSLNKTEVVKAMRDMHFYATEDCDSKVDFTVNTRIMGSIFTDRNAPVISATLTDITTNTSSAIIRIMSGTPGSGVMPVKIDSVIGNTIYFVDQNLANGSTAYYYIDITNGSSRIVTSPIWFTRADVSTPAEYYRSITTGNWNSPTTWESSSDGVTWSPASLTPDYNSNTITINNTVTVTANVTIDQTTISSGGLIIVNPNIVLTVNDGTGTDITIASGGKMILRSTATGTAIVGTSSGTVTGDVTAERFISAAYARSAWRLLTAPLSGSTNNSIFTNWQNAGVNTTGKGTAVTGATYSGAGTPGNPVSDANGLDYSTPGYSLKSYDVATQSLQNVTNTIATPLFDTKNNSYFIFINGDRFASSGNANTTTLSPTGNLQMGDKTFTTAATSDAFTLIGNPYAAPVDLNLFRQQNSGSNLKSSYYYWDPYLTGDYGVGGYVTVSYDGSGNETISPAGAAHTRHLQSGQAMFTQTKNPASGTASVTFTETQKSNTNVNNIFRTQTGNIENLSINLNVLSSGNAVLLDGIVASFDNSYSSSVDNYDAVKFYNIGESIAFIRENKAFGIERRDLLKSDDVLYINLQNFKQGKSYLFEILSDLNASGLNAYLVDSYLQTSTPIDQKGKTIVNFTITNEASSKGSNRFSIAFAKPAAVQIEPSISVFPNPVNNGVINLRMNNMAKGLYQVKVLNSMGQVLLNRQINNTTGNNTQTIHLGKAISKGIYQVEVLKPDNSIYRTKVIAN